MADRSSGLTLSDLVAGRKRRAAAGPQRPPAPRGFLSQFGDAFQDAASRSFVGAAVRKGADYLDYDKRKGETEDQHDARIALAERNRRSEYTTRSKKDGYLAYLSGQALGGVDPTYLYAPGGSIARRIIAQGAVQGVSSTARQGIEKKQGVRDRIDPLEIAADAGLGSAFQGLGETIGAGARAYARRGATAARRGRVVERARTAPADAEVDLRRVQAQRPEAEPTKYYMDERPVSEPHPADLELRQPRPVPGQPLDERQYARYQKATRRLKEAQDTGTPDLPGLLERPDADLPPVIDVPMERRAIPLERPDQPVLPIEEPLVRNEPLPDDPRLDTSEGMPETIEFPSNGRSTDVNILSTEGLKARLGLELPQRGATGELPLSGPDVPATPAMAALPPEIGPDSIASLRNKPQSMLEGQFPDEPTFGGGGGNEPPLPPIRNNNLATRDPSGPDFEASVNAERLGLTPEQRRVLAEAPVSAEYRSRADTEAAGDALGLTPDTVPTVGDLSATISAGDKLVRTTVDDVIRAAGTDGEAAALDGFVNSYGSHSQNVGETGRALNILRTAEYDKTGARIDNAEADKIVRENLANPETRDAALEAIQKAGNDPKKLKEIADKLRGRKAGDFVERVYYSAWLSDPMTQSRNILGNIEKLTHDIGIKGLTALVTSPLKLSAQADRAMGREVAGQMYGAWRGTLAGLKNFKTAYTRGSPADQVSREGTATGVGNAVSNVLEFGPRSMAVVDEVFRSAAFMSDLYRNATRNAIKDAGEDGGIAFKSLFDDIDNRVQNPSEGMIKAAAEYAKEARYQGKPGAVAGAVEHGLARLSRGTVPERVLGKTIRLGVLPFVRTPANILREAARNSPLGVMSSRNWQAFKQGGPARQEAITRVAFGSSVAGLTWNMAQNGEITGQGPADYKKLKALEGTGWRANSIKIGGKYIPFQGLGPLSIMLSGVATSAERFKSGELDGKAFGDKMAMASLGVADAALHNGWMESLANVFDALGKTSDEQREKAFSDAVASQAASPLAPGILRGINQSFFDPYARDTRSIKEGVEGTYERQRNRIQSAYPKLSQDLPRQATVYGEDNFNRRRGDGVSSFINPFTGSPDIAEPAIKELGRLERTGTAALVGPVPTTITVDGEKIKLPGSAVQEYQRLAGGYVQAAMQDFQSDAEWAKLSDPDKRTLVKQAVKDSRKWAKDQLIAGPDGEKK